MKYLKYIEGLRDGLPSKEDTSLREEVENTFSFIIDEYEPSFVEFVTGVIVLRFNLNDLDRLDSIKDYAAEIKERTELVLDVDSCVEQLRILIPDLVDKFSASQRSIAVYLGRGVHKEVISMMS